ncbi:N-acetyltransferase [Nocardioides zeae]|uniref:N-acetyltransferase n=1 Tax=Nocardioides imazamoxiresistens TaxID=3231893 RepID=A0ABU3PU27_9ACTN|nr:N-acetyltransferase [Nocardioides zeae]MDT9592362.1 N-acetyltransferase [Nocardioides zeae]
MSVPTTWATRPERPGDPADAAAVRAVVTAAFPSTAEADLVDALRLDADAWVEGLSLLACSPQGEVAGYALLTRCRVGGEPALALAPCAVLPAHQGAGAGSAATRAALTAAQRRLADAPRHEDAENLVVVLGHPRYYPRFGFTPASGHGVRAPFEVPDDAFLALALDPGRPTPRGTVAYPSAFRV